MVEKIRLPRTSDLQTIDYNIDTDITDLETVDYSSDIQLDDLDNSIKVTSHTDRTNLKETSKAQIAVKKVMGNIRN